MKKWFYLTAYIIPAMIIPSVFLGGYFYFLTPVFTFVMVPLLDLVMGSDSSNQDEKTYQDLRGQRFYRIITWLHVPLQSVLLLFSASLIGSGNLAVFEMVGLTWSMGIVAGGLGINIAHELGHRNNAWEQNLAKILLNLTSYGHFFIEHNQGHHARASTFEDPASARYGESFYAFYFRTVIGSWRSAWALERRRLARRKIAFWSYRNQMIWFTLIPIFIAAALGTAFGPLAFIFFFVQSWIGFSLLEVINYVEHYGLSRREIRPGKYEKVQPHHSWNASEVVTNYLLFHLQRHSDHHANANRRYQTLRHFQNAPQLPTGYGGMVLLALVPPLWKWIMNPRVDAIMAENMQPA